MRTCHTRHRGTSARHLVSPASWVGLVVWRIVTATRTRSRHDRWVLIWLILSLPLQLALALVLFVMGEI